MKEGFSDSVITIESADIPLGRVLAARARKGIARTAAKYFGRLTHASVYFSRESRSCRCVVTIQVGALPTVTARAQAPSFYLALNAALRKASKQLRRMKRAVRDDKSRPVPLNVPGRNGWRQAAA